MRLAEQRVKTALSYLIVIIDFGVLVLIWYCWWTGWLYVDDATTMLGILLPAAPGHALVMWRFIVDTRFMSQGNRRTVPLAFVCAAVFLLVVPAAFNVAVILRQAGGGVHFSQSKWMLLTMQSFFSGFVGYLIAKLYSRPE